MSVQALTANLPVGAQVFLVREDGSSLPVSGAPVTPGAAFYQTVEDDGSTLPQEPVLNIINGTLADNPGNTSTDLTLWYQQVGTPGEPMPQEPLLAFVASDFQLTDVAGETRVAAPGIAIAQAAAAAAQAAATAAQQPFRASFYVDPAFAGTHTGSSSNPFASVTAAQAAAAALALANAIFFLPPGVASVENLTIPAAGTWEIACESTTRLATITGTVNILSGSARLYLTNVTVSGAITGDAATGQSNFLVARNSRLMGALTLTGTGTGFWNFIGDGRGTTVNSLGGFVQGACAVTGVIDTFLWSFSSTVAWSATTTRFQYTQFNNGVLTANNSVLASVFMQDCVFAAATTINGAGAGVLTVIMDGFTEANVNGVGLTLAGNALTATRANLKTQNSNASNNLAVASNGAVVLTGTRSAEGLYEVVFDMTALDATGTGPMQLNVVYTDFTGTNVTEPVAVNGVPVSLALGSAAGTKARASMPFHHNGSATPISCSITGVVTPGNVALAVAVRRAN